MTRLVGRHQNMALPVEFWYWVVGLIGALWMIPFCTLLTVGLPVLIVATIIDFKHKVYQQWKLSIAVRQYIKVRIFQLFGMLLSWQYDSDSRKIRTIQEKTLLKFLALNADTAYSADHNLGNVRSISDFQARHPLIKYDHIRPYADKMRQGEPKQLTSMPPSYFGKTSGTTGAPSIIPFTKVAGKLYLRALSLFTYNADKSVNWSEVHWLRPIWKMTYHPPRIMITTPSGLKEGPITGNPAWGKFGEIYTTPTIVTEIEDNGAAGYIQLLFALRFRDLTAIEGIFASVVYFNFQKMEAEWEDLVRDIRQGTLKPNPAVPTHVRQELIKHLKPDPRRADELELEFSQGFENIAIRIWPNLAIINCITTGGFAIYAKYLRDHYTKEILLYPTSIGATEGFMAVNFYPFIQPSRFSILPRMMFYEFIPVEEVDNVNPGTLTADQVRLGHEYELVITTCVGVCRYRMGDVVKVVSFYNQIPIIEFVHRASASLNCKAEKVTEENIYTCLSEAATNMAPRLKRVADYTVCESIHMDVIHGNDGLKGSYHVLFVELVPGDPAADPKELAQEFGDKFDEALKRTHFRYAELREINGLGHPVVFAVKEGAFNRLKEHMMATSTVSFVQLKIPRVLQKHELLRFLLKERH